MRALRPVARTRGPRERVVDKSMSAVASTRRHPPRSRAPSTTARRRAGRVSDRNRLRPRRRCRQSRRRAPHLRRQGPPRRSSGDRPPAATRRRLTHWARAVPDGATKLAAAFWPGPLTLILPRASHVADIVTGGQDSVGLRVPSHPVARELLAAFGGGIAAPSANRFGRISPTTAQHVADDLGDAVATILDGGACADRDRIDDRRVHRRRPGAAAARRHRRRRAVARARAAAAPTPMRPRRARRARSPSHYAPRTPASLVAADVLRAEISQLDERDEIVAVLARTVARPADFAGVWLAGARRRRALRARSLCESARARRRERRRHPDRERCRTAMPGSPCATGSPARRAAWTTIATRDVSPPRSAPPNARARETPRSPRRAPSAGARSNGRRRRS